MLGQLFLEYVTVRHPYAKERTDDLRQFVENRCSPGDRTAMTGRYRMIADNDLRPIARATSLPVHYLAGLFDPLVPWPYIRGWLQQNCPGYRGGQTFWLADHCVLATEPHGCAKRVLQWMAAEVTSQKDI